MVSIFWRGKCEKIKRAASCVKWTDNICMGNTVKYIAFYYNPLQLLICTVLMVIAISGIEPEIRSTRNISSSLLIDLYSQLMKPILIPVSFRPKSTYVHLRYLKYVVPWRTMEIKSKKVWIFDEEHKGTYMQITVLQTFAKAVPNSALALHKYISTWLIKRVCWKVMVKSCPDSTLLRCPVTGQKTKFGNNFHRMCA